MNRKWVNFKELRTHLRFTEVLKHFGVNLTVKGEQATGFCPLPTHNGEGHTASFSAHLTKGIWQCFGCGAKGNVLDFAVRMDGLSPDKPFDVRTTAIKLQERFMPKQKGKQPTKPTTASSSNPSPKRDTSSPAGEKPTVINQPLDFELKGLDAAHPYLIGRGFQPKTIERFGLGFCSRGLLGGRVAIPIHNPQGRLIGYAGRVVDDLRIDAENPKYRFPGQREHDGVTHEFRKSLVLYNAHRVVAPAPTLIVVEGFASVWWLYQFGFKDVVALMGWSCSPEQAQIILSKVPEDGRVIAFTDGDDAGKRCGVSVFEQVAEKRSVRWARLTDGRQPTDLGDAELFQVLSDR